METKEESTNPNIDPWTPADRDSFIALAINSEDDHGSKGRYHYNVMPRQPIVDGEDIKRQEITDLLSEILSMPQFRCIPLHYYGMLCNKLAQHPMLCYHMNRDVVVTLKGGNAHRYLVASYDKLDDELFKFSDTDICVWINPELNEGLFESVRYQVELVIRQTMSQYKRLLDQLMFYNKPVENSVFSPELIADFKATLNSMITEVQNVKDVTFYSPFEADEVRNQCSKNSCIYLDSKVREDCMVRIEVPHLDKCERIPLGKSPLVMSQNTVKFLRDGEKMVGNFSLYRLKMHMLAAQLDEEGGLEQKEKIPADFLDVVVLRRDDAELVHFWTHGRTINVFDHDIHMWITVPDLQTTINELKRILEVYENIPAKRAKRVAKLEFFEKL